jgi:hypothetical protein
MVLLVGSGWSSLQRPVAQITLYDPQVVARASYEISGWHGTIPLWRYCALEPGYPRCC